MRASLIVAAMVSGCVMPAPAVEMEGNTIKLSAEELKRCQAEGGCVVITVEMLQNIVDVARMCMRKNSV